jgi:putative phosphoribosyl transferase
MKRMDRETQFQSFRDRSEAGRLLAARLAQLKPEAPVILALPRGGVPVGCEIATALEAPLDVVLVRKLRAPFQPELALGAVVDGDPPEIVMNPEVDLIGVSPEYVAAEIARQTAEIARRRALYANVGTPVTIAGRTVVLVDDGVATGATMRAALRAARRQGADRLVVAAPVAATDTAAVLEREADEAIFLIVPPAMAAIGRFYTDFPQLTDGEVCDLLRRARTAPHRADGCGREHRRRGRT